MIRLTLAAVALIAVVGTPTARGQNPDETQRLKDRIELLETKLKLAEKEIESLKSELKLAKRSSEKPAASVSKQPSLSDLLVDGAVFKYRAKFVTGDRHEGGGTITIDSREGNTFRGTRTGGSDKGVINTYKFKGTIRGNRATVETLNAPINVRVNWELRKDGSSIATEGVMPGGGLVRGSLTPEDK